MDKWEKAHRANLNSYSRRIDAIYQSAVREAASIGVTIRDFSPDKLFSFTDYPITHKRIDNLINELAAGVNTTIINGIDAEWTLANNKNNELCNFVFGEATKKLSREQERKYYKNNHTAREAFKARKTDGLDLSDRVWNYSKQFKTEIEMGLDLGLRDGLSAADMTRDLKQYLKYPDKLFRRVRDEHGQLHLSKAAKAFNPGQGVYRSSYKNALRLTRTENNIAYRTSDYTRWQQLDFVVGIEIHLSNNHPVADICNELAGKYPKDFKFTGWHPQCRCYATSILKTREEIAEDNKRILRGESINAESANTITDAPPALKQWAEKNADRISRAKQLPYFMRDNEQYFAQTTITNKAMAGVKEAQKFNKIIESKPTLLEMAAQRHAARTAEQVAAIQARWNASRKEARRQEILRAAEIRHKARTQESVDLIKKQWGGRKYSANMPEILKTEYLNGEKYTFDKTFFDLLDSKKPIKLEVVNSGKGSYSSFQGDLVHIVKDARGLNSKWESKAVIYHEYGHCIDAQRNLWTDERLIDMRNSQIKLLKTKDKYSIWQRKWRDDSGWFNTKVTSEMSRVEYIDNRLSQLSSKIAHMSEDTFVKRGISKYDVLEQIGSTSDTIKSLVVKYGYGHSSAYFKRIRMSETEYLAHAFENAFLGNRVFQKYLPDVYKEMVDYVRALKPL